ncbi:MAG: hypothetical protein ACRDK0_01350 [Solirubrobacteraceae bacterium]
MLRIDDVNQAGHYDYYLSRFASERNYVVKLGRHQVVMTDTGPDIGAPRDADWDTQALLIWKKLTDGFTEDERAANSGSPNSATAAGGLGLLRDALASAGDGLVIVGMHAPAFSPPGGEYPYFLRETQHPWADSAEIPGYMRRFGQPPTGQGWVPTGTPHFKAGPVAEGLDHGVARQDADELVRLAAGEGAPRPVDLILCGHQHDRVEFRFRLDPGSQELEYFMDFYTENPERFYWTINNTDRPELPAGHPIHIVVRDGAPPDALPTIVRDRRDDVVTTTATLEVPPYATPLATIADVADWWRSHRPLMLQAPALGPLEPRQRLDPRWGTDDGVWESPLRPPDSVPLPPYQLNALFRGFRLVQVEGGTIHRIRHIELAELHAHTSAFRGNPRATSRTDHTGRSGRSGRWGRSAAVGSPLWAAP